MSKIQYCVICQSVIGGMDRSFSIHYGFDGSFFSTRKAAIKWGWKLRDSDDFNIASTKDGKLTGFFWMDEPMMTDEQELRQVSEAIFGEKV